MFRFSIRDLLWVTFLVGFCLHAWTSRIAREAAYRRRVNEEVEERLLAEAVAKEAEQKAQRSVRYAQVIRDLQTQVLMMRYGQGVPSEADLPYEAFLIVPTRRFMVRSDGTNQLGLRELCQRFTDERWIAGRLTPDQSSEAVLDEFKRALHAEAEMLDIECIED